MKPPVTFMVALATVALAGSLNDRLQSSPLSGKMNVWVEFPLANVFSIPSEADASP